MIKQIGGQIRHDAGGEGSKGGHIIGHTKSGKPIYESHTHPVRKTYTPQDHEEAMMAHLKEREEHFKKHMEAKGKDSAAYEHHWGMVKQHQRAVDYHGEGGGPRPPKPSKDEISAMSIRQRARYMANNP